MQIAIIGLGNFGLKLAETLHNLGGEVIVIDKDEELVEEAKKSVNQAVCLDATDEKALRAIGIPDVDTAVVAMATSMEASIFVTTLLRQMGVSRIIARALSNLHEKVLLQVGASQVIRIEEEMGEQVAKWVIAHDILNHHSFGKGFSLVETKPREIFIGKKIVEIGFETNFKLGLAALHKRTPEVDNEGRSIFKTKVLSPVNPDEFVGRDDILVLCGLDENIEKFTTEAA